MFFKRMERVLQRSRWLRGDYGLALKAAGISDFRFHDLRHTFATQQRFLGRDIGVIKELLGHRCTKMTGALRAHILPAELKEANDALGEKIMGKLAQKKHNDVFAVQTPDVLHTRNEPSVIAELNLWPCGGMADAADLKSAPW